VVLKTVTWKFDRPKNLFAWFAKRRTVSLACWFRIWMGIMYCAGCSASSSANRL